PADMMSKSKWKSFWKLPIPHGVRNCWWRLLIRKLPTRLALRYTNTETSGNTLCQFCENNIEDEGHMVFYCKRKQSFWYAARYKLGLNIPVTQIWPSLIFSEKTDPETLTSLGLILLVVWQMHWQCTRDNQRWDTTNALQRLRRTMWLNEHKDVKE
ncbi:uncharacterized protein BX664DRAFT_265365, partial [Halteromyces radiatus]|uniref:uncharacterized protein n=1 Tax=Halteromyces radiatus TaxID=101107 RepID=UPI00221F7ECA